MVDADVRYLPEFLTAEQSNHCYLTLLETLKWRQDSIKLYGKTVKIPRLQAWYGDPCASYRYSGIQLQPLPWTSALWEIKQRCESVCETGFNSVLANYYRDGQDSMGWHSDDEPELGEQPIIASLSVGQTREFDFRHKLSGEKYRISLPPGSLLIMSGPTQRFWQHGITKRKTNLQGRINLTFRTISSS